LFAVACGLILLESWRRDRKDKKQDADVAEKLGAAERERVEMREKMEEMQREIEALLEKKPFTKPAGAPTKESGSDNKSKDEKPKEPLVRMSSAPAPEKEEKSNSTSLSALLPSNWLGTGKGSTS